MITDGSEKASAVKETFIDSRKQATKPDVSPKIIDIFSRGVDGLKSRRCNYSKNDRTWESASSKAE
jgi:hypothetical protein